MCLRAKHGQWITRVDTETPALPCYVLQTGSVALGRDEEDEMRMKRTGLQACVCSVESGGKITPEGEV